MSDVDFGAPVFIDELPPAASPGRASVKPAIVAWLNQIPAGKTAELASKDEDGAHSFSRANQVRKIGKEMGFEILTRPVKAGKRYRVFATNKNTEAAAETTTKK